MDIDVVKRKKKQKSGIFAGIICILLATIILFYNEGRAVDTQKVINIAKEELIEVSSSTVDPNNEGKLIVTSGQINLLNDMVYDSEFNVSMKTGKLTRVVEMYQWTESCEDDSNGTETCTYTKKWSSDIIDDKNFETGHNNPDTMPYESKTFIMDNVKLGAFKLNNNLLNQLSTRTEYKELSEDVANSKNLNIKDGAYTTYEETPEVGDVRISFLYNDAKDITIMGVQRADSFEEFKTDKHDYTILALEEKILNGTEFTELLTSQNKTMTWIFRLVGTVLMIAGVASILSIIKYLASFIPFLGKFVMNAVGLISILVGLALSLVIIAISWFAVRPVLSIILLVVIGGLIYLSVMINKKKKQTQEPTAQTTVPVQPVQPVTPEQSTQVQDETNKTL